MPTYQWLAAQGDMSVASLLQQLQSNEAVLMMYVADELPPEDRAEVERRLATDDRLRADLEQLRDAHDVFAAAMPTLDRSTRPPVPEAVAVRRVVAAVRQWHSARVLRPAAEAPPPSRRVPKWAYPLATAASVVIGFVVWWGLSDRREVRHRYAGPNLPLQLDPGERPSTPDFMAAMILATSGPVDPPEEVVALIAPTDYAVLAPHAALLLDPSDSGTVEQPEEQDPAQIEREQDDSNLFL